MRISIAATSIGLSVIIIANGIFNGFQKEISTKVFGFWGHIHITDIRVNRSIEPIPLVFNDSLQEMISGFEMHGLQSIKHYQKFIIAPGIISHMDYADGLFFKGLSSDFDWDLFGSYIKEGRHIKLSDTISSRDIMISDQTAHRLFIKLDDYVVLHYIKGEHHIKRKLKVCGIYKTGLEEYDRKFALVDNKLLQDLLNWEDDEYTGVEIFVNEISEAQAICNTLYEDVLPSKLYAETIREKFPNIFEWLALQNINKAFILGMVLLVCLINMATMLLILILERTHMIGILSALGMRGWDQRKVFLYFSSKILLQGMLFGNLIGLSLLYLQHHFKFIHLSEQDYYLSYAPVDIDLNTILLINLTFFIVILICLIIPSYFISKLRPIEALKFR